MRSATFKDFEGKPLGILCQDGLILTGLALALDGETGTLTLSQATTFLNGTIIKKPVAMVGRDSVADACVLPSLEALDVMPDLCQFPSHKAAAAQQKNSANFSHAEGFGTKKTSNSLNVSTASGSSRQPKSTIGNGNEISEDDFERIRFRSDEYPSDFNYAQREPGIARGEKFRLAQPLFEDTESSLSRFSANNQGQRSSGSYSKRSGKHNQYNYNYQQSPRDQHFQTYRDRTRNNYLTPGESDVNDSDYQVINSHGHLLSKENSDYTKPVYIRTKHKLRKEPVDWCLDNINGPESEVFDFQGNLDLFNKEEEFAKIKEQDTIPYEDRLVGHNRRRPSRYDTGRQSPFPPPPRNLKNTENVLDENELLQSNLEISNDAPIKRNNNLVKAKGFLQTDSGLLCPMVSKEALLQVERLAMSETGPNEDQLVENAGRTIAKMALKALGGPRRFSPENSNDLPIIIILAGNNKTGAYGICASRHLANRGCQIYLLTVGNPQNLLKTIYEQQRYAACAGVKVIREAKDLPDSITCPVDLIIDSLLGYDKTLSTLPDSGERIKTADLIDWANSNNAPVISIGAPSGLMEDSAISGFSPTSDYVRPKWTLSLGAPTVALANRSLVGEVYLGDVGIPTSLWKRVSVYNWRAPFGADFLVRLNYY